MKFGYTIIYVQSVPDTLSFYSAAFGLPVRFCLPTNDYGELDLPGSTTLAFASEAFVKEAMGTDRFRPNRKDGQPAAGAEISFVVEEGKGETVDSVLKQAVQAGGIEVMAPAKKPWGQTVGYVKDCNGFLVEICTPVVGQ